MFCHFNLRARYKYAFRHRFLDRLEASDPIGVKNLIGRAGRSSESPEFDYGCVVIRSSGMTKFRKLMNTEDRLSSKSMLDEERLDDDD